MFLRRKEQLFESSAATLDSIGTPEFGIRFMAGVAVVLKKPANIKILARELKLSPALVEFMLDESLKIQSQNSAQIRAQQSKSTS